MHWSRYCLLAALVGGTAVALQIPRPVNDREWSPGYKAQETAELAEGLVEPGTWDDLVAGIGGGCKSVGNTAEFFDRTNHYRGNVYRITRSVSLTRIGMLMGMNNSTPLYVSVHRRQSGTTGAWVRYPEGSTDILIPSPSATGVANPIFHNTPELDPPISLEAGFDYAIAYSWTASVRYFKDLFQVYPGATPDDFDFGLVMGLIGLNPVTPPMNDSLVFSVSSSGAYAMSLCLTGACCSTSGNCADVSAAQCGGGQFTAAGVTCADIDADTTGNICPLPNGACCLPNTCSFTNKYDCIARTGDESNWHLLTSCSDVVEEPCAPRGGCCSSDGSCQDGLTINSCTNLGGIYRGDGITCDTGTPCSLGACCNTDDLACVGEYTRAACEGGGSEFSFVGPGTSCEIEPDPCIPIGACCNPTTGVCTNNLTQAQCEVGGRVFRGDNSRCEELEPACGLGACCTLETGCEDSNGAGLDAGLCAAIGGTFRGDGTTCATLSPGCSGTCCRGTGLQTCNRPVQPEQCNALSGTFIGYNQPCPTQQGQANPCSVITPSTGGACCLPSGACSKVSTEAICVTQLFGEFNLGLNCSQVDCVPPPPLGACCNRLVQACVADVEEADCSGFGRVWLEDSGCDSFNPPCLPTGACCDQANLTCQDGKLQSECQFAWTANARCDALNPPCAPTGACCLGTECEIETDQSCNGLGGSYKGDDEACAVDTCVPVGACCDGESCIPDSTEAACDATQGVYQGDDSECVAGETCIPLGACCDGQTCGQSTEENCLGVYKGDGVACGPANPCIPTGACCTGLQGNCSVSSEATCTGGGGAYAGDSTTCETSPCDRGACCANTEEGCGCTSNQFQYECRELGGQFFVDVDCEAVGECPVEIISSDPRDCALDARQSPPGSGPAGEVDAVLIKFNCDVAGLVAADLEIFQVPPQGTPLAIDHVMVNGNEVQVMFDGPIPLQVWTCVRHIASDTQTCVSYLPGDVNNNEITTADDVQALVADLEAGLSAVPQMSLTSIQCDLDRSDACTPLDILRGVDLFNGADEFATWANNVTQAPCPSLAP